MSAKPTLLDLVLSADGKELDVLDQKIAEKLQVVEAAQAEVDKLKALRKTINVLVNGKPERKPRAARKERPPANVPGSLPNSAEDRRKRIALYLSEHGATRPAELAIQLKEDLPNINYSVSNGWFAKTERGIVLTPEGRNKYLES